MQGGDEVGILLMNIGCVYTAFIRVLIDRLVEIGSGIREKVSFAVNGFVVVRVWD